MQVMKVLLVTLCITVSVHVTLYLHVLSSFDILLNEMLMEICIVLIGQFWHSTVRC